ncbi:hypothetical protein [Curtobacterium sp. ISL-83]|uniref:hypothetical protein n=1 Tax=Curtobacterium sp. ISL-83 TaxID=2819145 RepID=UPI001BEAAF75|nr:hypothetical protein [Curtobacterium sp. ISL-83]MBT2503871.1 hypothetical protein [Curtobacterium sp. ISL-83]
MRRRTLVTIVVLSVGVTVGLATAGYRAHAATVEVHRLQATNASPETMTRVYLRAAADGDCSLTRRLTLPHTSAWCSAPLSWLTDSPDLVSYRDVGTAVHESEGVADRDQVCVPSTIDQRDLSGAEPGTMSWEWCWVRTADGWRLWDQGQG